MQKHHTQENKDKGVRHNAENSKIDQASEEAVQTKDQPKEEPEMEKLKKELQDLQEKYLRQVAEFDNFRKRTAREKAEWTQTAGRDIIVSLLPALDDMDRAEKQMENIQDPEILKQGIHLIFQKVRNTLQARGLRAMNTTGQDFNPDLHEAITEVPAPTPELKGKVVDELEKGYYLNDKIIRFAKVVVGK